MRIENTRGPLQALCDKLFCLVEELSGARPQLDPSFVWYRAQSNGKAFLYLRVIGERARTFPPNSVHLTTAWDDRLAIERVTAGNNWYGERSADLSVQAAKPDEIGFAEEFIRTAFHLYGKRG